VNLARTVLGASAVDRLSTAAGEAVLVVGSDTFTRSDLSAVGCFNFVAARYLTHALHDLGVTNLRDVYDRVPPRDLALPGVGVISLAVLGAAFEAKHIGGDSPLETYVRKHQTKLTTFDTVKHAVKREQLANQQRRRKRRRRLDHVA
jgi:hypothetical protein